VGGHNDCQQKLGCKCAYKTLRLTFLLYTLADGSGKTSFFATCKTEKDIPIPEVGANSGRIKTEFSR